MDSQCFQVVKTDPRRNNFAILDNGKTYLDLSHSLDIFTSGRPSGLFALNAETQKLESCNGRFSHPNHRTFRFEYVNPDDTRQVQSKNTVSGSGQSAASHLASEKTEGHAAHPNDERSGFHFICIKTEDDQYKLVQTSRDVKEGATDCETLVIQDETVTPSDSNFVYDTSGTSFEYVNNEKIAEIFLKSEIAEETIMFCNQKNSDLHLISTNAHTQTTNSDKMSGSLLKLNTPEKLATVPNPMNSSAHFDYTNSGDIEYVHTNSMVTNLLKLKIPEEISTGDNPAYSGFMFVSEDRKTKRGRFRRGSSRSIARDNKRSCVPHRMKPTMFTAHDQWDLLLRVTRCNNNEIARLSEERKKQKSQEIKIISDSVPRFIPTSDGNIVKETFAETLVRLLKEKLNHL